MNTPTQKAAPLRARWAEVEGDLCDPAWQRHERALRRFVEHGR